MSSETLQEARTAVVRGRAMEGAAAVLARGEDLTFAKLAEAAGVPERAGAARRADLTVDPARGSLRSRGRSSWGSRGPGSPS